MSKKGQTNRREVLLATLGAGIAASAASGGSDIPYRVLGRTGEKVSCIGMGGYHLGKKEVTEGDALTLVRTGVDRGINFLDNSWDYNKERARRGLGKR